MNSYNLLYENVTKLVEKNWKKVSLIFFTLGYLPLIYLVPLGWDQGSFLYTGTVISNGGNPYSDSWDFKGPLIYYLNALSVSLFDHPRGIFILEMLWNGFFIFVALSLVEKTQLLSRFFYPLTVAILSFMLIMMGGNLTETWSFGPQILSYSILYRVLNITNIDLRMRKAIFYCTIQSIIFFICFELRPNNAMGVLVALTITTLVLAKKFEYRGHLIYFIQCLNLTLLFGVSFIFIIAQGYWSDYLEQAFLFNFYYADQFSNTERINNAIFLFSKIFKTPIIIFAIFNLIWVLITNQKILRQKVFASFLIILLADILSVTISGMPWLHYLILVIPSSLFLSYILMPQKYINLKLVKSNTIFIFSCILFLVSIGLIINSRWYTAFTEESYKNKESILYKTSQFISNNTDTEDKLYVWGTSPTLLVYPFRYSVSSVTFIYSTMVPNPNQDIYGNKITNDIISGQPKYIFQANRYCISSPGCNPKYPDSMERIISYINQNYQPIQEINGKLTIWERNIDLDKKKQITEK
jgi:hypothetical protein